MKYICFFHESRATELAEVGGKGSNLGKLTGAGFPVPPGFCVAVAAYRFLLEKTALDAVIARKLARLDFQDYGAVRAAALSIRDLVAAQPIPIDIAHEVQWAYEQLDQHLQYQEDRPLPVAVRSSATAEDLPQASFAGQQETYLNICGPTSLLEHMRLCWASLWTERAVIYRQQHHFDQSSVSLAVVVQAMVESQMAGIIFTANPVTGNREQCVINASWGLGDAVVSGLVSPDTYTVSKANGRILEQHIASKERPIVSAQGGGAIEVATDPQLCKRPVLSERQVAELTALASRVEDHYGTPQDVEWAYDNRWYILQSRPITSLKAAAKTAPIAGHYSRAMFKEIFPEAISPAFISVVTPLLSNMLDFTFRQLGLTPAEDMAAVRDFYNQPYFNVSYIEASFASLPRAERRRLTAQFANPIANDEEPGRISPTQVTLLSRMMRFWWRFRRRLPALLQDFRDNVAALDALVVESTAEAELLRRLRRIIFDDASQLLNGDFLLIALAGTFRRFLLRLLARTYPEEAPQLLNALISGVSGNVIMETNLLLWELAARAKENPALGRIVLEKDPGEMLAALELTADGREFLQALQEVLDICGHREMHLDILYPTWKEDPTPVFGFIRGYMTAAAQENPAARAARLVRERETLTARVIADLRCQRLGRVIIAPLFRWLLHQLHELLRERDTMHFEWTRLFPPVRKVLLEVGKRWSHQELLARPGDIFYLRLEEMEAIARRPTPQQERVAARRTQLAENLHGPWPEILKRGQQTFGAEEAGRNGRLRGIAGSPGKVTGTCRVIRSPAEFERLQAGEVLVAPFTNPVWTPLFAIAAGIVTNVGGILSHGAIIAREYGIPAVMSVAGATDHLVDGQVVTVDGNLGTVTLLPGGSKAPR